MKKKSVLAISIAIISIVWALAVVAYVKLFDLAWMCWGSITCTMIAAITTELYMLVFRKDLGKNGGGNEALGIILTISYFLIVLLLNSVFALLQYGDFNLVLLVLNLFALASYIILLIWVENSNTHLARRGEETAYKVAPTVDISKKLGELLSVTQDADVRGRLLKFKESVDYSSNVSTPQAASNISRVAYMLDDIARLVIAQTDQMIILNRLNAAESAWKLRNTSTPPKMQ